MFLALSTALATDLRAPAAEPIVALDHEYVGGLVDRRGRCSNPAALAEVLRLLAIDETAQLKDFEVGAPALPSRKLTIDLQSADVHGIFRMLAERGDINIVVADGVSGEVTMRLEDTPWDQVLEVVLVSAHLDALVGDNLIVVYPL